MATTKTTTAEKLAADHAERERLWIIFEGNGGRGVELANEIDFLDRRIARLEARLRREAKA